MDNNICLKCECMPCTCGARYEDMSTKNMLTLTNSLIKLLRDRNVNINATINETTLSEYLNNTTIGEGLFNQSEKDAMPASWVKILEQCPTIDIMWTKLATATNDIMRLPSCLAAIAYLKLTNDKLRLIDAILHLYDNDGSELFESIITELKKRKSVIEMRDIIHKCKSMYGLQSTINGNNRHKEEIDHNLRRLDILDKLLHAIDTNNYIDVSKSLCKLLIVQSQSWVTDDNMVYNDNKYLWDRFYDEACYYDDIDITKHLTKLPITTIARKDFPVFEQ